MEKLSAEELGDYLKGRGCNPDLVNRLIDEGIDGAEFADITPEILRACNFKAGEIAKIIKFQQMPYEKQQPHSNITQASQDSTSNEMTSVTGGDTTTNHSHDESIEDDDSYSELRPYFSPMEFKTFSPYLKDSYANQLARYNQCIALELPNPENCLPPFVKKFREDQAKLQRKDSLKNKGKVTIAVRRSTRVPTNETTLPSQASGRNLLQISSNAFDCVKAAASSPEGRMSSRAIFIGGAGPSGSRNATLPSPIRPSSSLIPSPLQIGSSSSAFNQTVNFQHGRSSSDDSDDETLEMQVNMETAALNTDEPPFPEEEEPQTAEQVRLMSESPELPTYNIFEILNTLFKEGKDCIKESILRLKIGGISALQRKRVMRALALHLSFKIAGSPQKVTPDMKEGLAKCFCIAFPAFVVTSSDGRKPWGLIFNRQTGTGFLANACRAPAAANPKRPKKKPKLQGGKGKENADPKVYNSDYVQDLAVTMPDRSNRTEILDAMSNTFTLREAEREKGISIREMMQKYPHFGSYEGEVLREEFKKLQPNAKDGCKDFTKLLPEILKLTEKRAVTLKCDDDVVKALVLLSQHLPHDVRKKDATAAKLDDLIVVLKTADDVESFIDKKVIAAKSTIQPYIILVRGAIGRKIIRSFLVLDKKPVQLPSTTLKALDALFKSFFVFNVKYPIGWNNVFHFLATCFYGIFEGNRKRPDCIAPNEHSLYTQIGGTFT